MTDVAAPGLTVRVESFEGPWTCCSTFAAPARWDCSTCRIRAVTDQYLAHL